jgi:hypothetical protein
VTAREMLLAFAAEFAFGLVAGLLVILVLGGGFLLGWSLAAAAGP